MNVELFSYYYSTVKTSDDEAATLTLNQFMTLHYRDLLHDNE